MPCKISTSIQDAIQILNRDELIGLPTETVYGLAGNGLSPAAVEIIYRTKNRPSSQPLILHIAGPERVEDLVSACPTQVYTLIEHFWPGPLTLVLPKSHRVPDQVTGQQATVAIRMPSHDLALELLRQLPYPLAAPSANPFTRISPTTAHQVAEYFPEQLEMVLDGGACQQGLESTILYIENQDIFLLRRGTLLPERIEEVVKQKLILPSTLIQTPKVPGSHIKHYAPRTRIEVIDSLHSIPASGTSLKIGLLLHQGDAELQDRYVCKVLSKEGDLKEIASNFYQALQELDAQGLDLIVTEAFVPEGLGLTLNDRLFRAAAK